MTALAVDFAGIGFQNPIVLASGTAAFGRELRDIVDLEQLGGLVTKACHSCRDQERKRHAFPIFLVE